MLKIFNKQVNQTDTKLWNFIQNLRLKQKILNSKYI